jgi:hypothetical protein
MGCGPSLRVAAAVEGLAEQLYAWLAGPDTASGASPEP